MQKIIISETLDFEALGKAVDSADPDKVLLLSDSNVARLIPQRLAAFGHMITFEAGEENKNLDTLARIWQSMLDAGATRRSLLINVGGGVVTDIGGFAAATFKRGIPFINIATTLLAAVDASIGGKTGIDFAGLKNQIGAFAAPQATFIPTAAWRSLPPEQLLSGFGEIVKCAYLRSPQAAEASFEAADTLPDISGLRPLLDNALHLKQEIVDADPLEHGVRAYLNFGHTGAHAFEALAMRKEKPLPHGIAVAHGILLALILSHTTLGLPSRNIYRYADAMLRRIFPPLPTFGCDDYHALLKAMAADKKNRNAGKIRFVLLSDIGCPEIRELPQEDIFTALDIFRDISGM